MYCILYIYIYVKCVCKLCKLITAAECYGSTCNKLITIVNYYLESGLSCIVY